MAAGVYYPDEGDVRSNNDPSEIFYLPEDLQHYGGFDTCDKKRSDRDRERNVTVLSGDIDKNNIKDSNDVVSDPSKIKGVNAYHVVTAVSGSVHSTLDGFTITAGQAIGSVDPDRYGGGFTKVGNLRLQRGSPAIDAGDNFFVAGVDNDLDGEPRIVDGDSDGTPSVDMGAYEYQIPYKYDDYLPMIFR